MKKDIQEKTKKLAEVKKADEKLAARLKQVRTFRNNAGLIM